MPSGVSYVMANRRAMAKVFPEAFATMRIRPVDDYPRRLLAALRAAAPDGVDRPDRRGAHPGRLQPRLLRARAARPADGRRAGRGPRPGLRRRPVRMRTTQGEQPVDVIYRRVDDEFLDPVQFRADSVLGSPGLVNARARRQRHDRQRGRQRRRRRQADLHLRARPDPVLPRRGADPAQRRHLPAATSRPALAGRARPPRRAGGQAGRRVRRQGHRDRPGRDGADLDELRKQLIADPRGWIAQPVVQLSTVPTLIDGRIAPRHVDLRPFAVNDGERVWVLPGGLTRVALPEGELVVNSSQGGGSKDTWVLADRRPAGNAPSTAARQPRGGRHERAHGSRPRTACASSSSSSSSRPRAADGRGATRAEPDRRVAVLDRPLHRAGRRHRPHPRRLHLQLLEDPCPTRTRGAHPALGDHGVPSRATSGSPTSAPRWPSTAPTPARSPAPGAARENARRARETLSTELWEGSTRPGTAGTASAATVATERHLSWVRERAALVSGIADSTMTRDEAWHFLVLGRSLERADMTARLVATGGLPRGGAPWSVVLSSCGAQQAFMRSQRGLLSDDRAAAFLVLDRRVPALGAVRAVRGRAPARRPGAAAGPDRGARRGPAGSWAASAPRWSSGRPPTSSPTCPPRCSGCRAR